MIAIYVHGGGLPMNAHPPPRFVTQGVYRLVSHPVYAGFSVLCIGVAIAWDRNTWNLTFSRTCAKLCHTSGGESEQIEFLLGHASVQTTESYLGCRQNLGHPVNDRFVLVPMATVPT